MSHKLIHVLVHVLVFYGMVLIPTGFGFGWSLYETSDPIRNAVHIIDKFELFLCIEAYNVY